MKVVATALVAVLVTAPALVQALPVTYMITFDGSNTAAGGTGGSGTGSFLYDAGTTPPTMTSLIWDFGSGLTGGVTDAYLAKPVFEINQGTWWFRNIFQNTNNPSSSGASSSGGLPDLIGPFPDFSLSFCWGTSSNVCGMANPLNANGSYKFQHVGTAGTAPTAYRGYLIVTASSVPEPATLALLGLGLAGLGFSRHRIH